VLSCNSSNFKNAEMAMADSTKDSANENDVAASSIANKQSTSIEKRMIIKTATITGTVNDYDAFYKNLNSQLKKVGAYVNNEEEQRTNYAINNTFEIKVPNEDFDSAIGLLINKLDKISSRKIKATDVSATVLDLESRLNTKTKMIERYRDFVQQAKNVEEILKVEEHIRVLQEEIEATTARIKYYNTQVAYSTIHLHVTKYIEQPVVSASFGFFKKMKIAFFSGWKSLLTAIIGFTYAWPFWLFLGTISFLIYTFIRRKRVAA